MSPKITQVDSFMILNVLIYFYSIQIRWGFHLLHIAMQFIITFITIPGTEYRVDPRWRIRRPFPISSGCRTRAASTPIVWAASLINRTDCSTVFVLAATKSWATSDLRSVLDARSDENESILTLKCLQKKINSGSKKAKSIKPSVSQMPILQPIDSLPIKSIEMNSNRFFYVWSEKWNRLCGCTDSTLKWR